MYILKNAITSIKRNKGRNILIGIIIIVISAASAITLAIRESATKIVTAYENKNPLTATIGMNRENLMKSLRENDKSQEEMINAFNEIESITEDQIKEYGNSSNLKSYYYTYELSVDAKDIKEATQEDMYIHQQQLQKQKLQQLQEKHQVVIQMVEECHQEDLVDQPQLLEEKQLQQKPKKSLMKKPKMEPLP